MNESGFQHHFAQIESQLHWQQTASYTVENIGQHYLDAYGYCNFLGSKGVVKSDCGMSANIASDHVALGIGIWGPE